MAVDEAREGISGKIERSWMKLYPETKKLIHEG